MSSDCMILTLACPDRPGIVAKVSTFLFERGCNILDAQQYDDEETDRFFALLRGGVKIVFEPSATVIHSFPTDWRAFRRSLFHAGCGHTARLTKCFLEQPALRGKVLRYVASRLGRKAEQAPNPHARADFPRPPLVLGSLYGPVAFLLSGRNKA